MRKINNKILEAVNRGIKLALDDYEEYNDDQLLSKADIIKSDEKKKKKAYMDIWYVDLGLPSGTLWCKYNFGVNPHKLRFAKNWYGNYYMWGERMEKHIPTKYYSADNWKQYRFGHPNKISKYNEDDQLTHIENADDVTFLKSHGELRMPSAQEIYELIHHTSFNWVEDYNDVRGLDGMLFINPYNNKELFIPAAGSQFNQDAQTKGNAYVWSANICEDSYDEATVLTLNYDKLPALQGRRRAMCIPIRPVCNEIKYNLTNEGD